MATLNLTIPSRPNAIPVEIPTPDHRCEALPKVGCESRRLKISSLLQGNCVVPWVRMSGKWLERAGFSIGARIKVKVTRGRLIVDVEPAADKVPAQKSYSYLSDVDIPQVFYCHDDPSPEPVPQSAPTRVNTLNPGVKHKAAGARAGWHERIRTALPRQLGSLLQNERARRDLDRGEIAVHAGVNRPHYGAIEQGSQQPNLSTFISLAWAFNEEPRDLFDRLLEQLGFSSGTRPLPAIL